MCVYSISISLLHHGMDFIYLLLSCRLSLDRKTRTSAKFPDSCEQNSTLQTVIWPRCRFKLTVLGEQAGATFNTSTGARLLQHEYVHYKPPPSPLSPVTASVAPRKTPKVLKYSRGLQLQQLWTM